MIAPNATYQRRYKCYSLLMLLALAWLTISLPFVYASQQAQKATVQKQEVEADSDSNPLTNTTEEKTSTGMNLSEYLHESHTTDHPTRLITKAYNSHTADVYIAFHPELICPPPDARVS